MTFLTFAIMLRPLILIMTTYDPIFFEPQMSRPWIVHQRFMFALVSCWVGLILSYMLPETPTGPSIVLVAGVFWHIRDFWRFGIALLI